MDVRISFLFLVSVALLCDLSYGKRKKAKKNKKTVVTIYKEPGESNKIKELEEEIKKLKEKVDELPKQVVNIHVHNGDHAEDHKHHMLPSEHKHHDHTTDDKDDGHHEKHDHKKHDHKKEHDHHEKHDHDSHDHNDIHFFMHLVDHHHDHHDKDEVIHAHCEVKPNSNIPDGKGIHGHIHFSQKGNGPVDIHIQMGGFDMSKDNPDMVHGFHVHALGDMSNSCDSLGKHFNPHGTAHGAQDAETRHVGDLGNIACDMAGEMDTHMTDDMITLRGKDSIIGRSMMIHKTKDDLGLGGTPGSLSGGNAGPRIACCIIGHSGPMHTDEHHSTTKKSVSAVSQSITTESVP